MALVMSQMPDVWRKVLAEHVPDQSQRCRECRDTAGQQASWPCQTYRVAQEAKWVSEGNLPGTGPHGPGPSATPRLSRLDSSGFRSPAPRQGGYGLPGGSYGGDPYDAGPSRPSRDSGLGGSFGVSGDGGYSSARGSGGAMYGAEPTGSGSYGSASYGSDPYSSDPYGSGSYGSSSYGSDPFSSGSYGSSSYGSSSYGSGSPGGGSYGGSYSSGSYGSDAYGSGSLGGPSSPYGSGAYGSDPYRSGSHRSDSPGAGGYDAAPGRPADDHGYGSATGGSGRSRSTDDSPPYGSRFDAPYGASFGVDDRSGPSWR